MRAPDAALLEAAINGFLAEELPQIGSVQLEEITQSESAAGVTVVIWYSLLEEEEARLAAVPDLPDEEPAGLA